MFSDLHVHVTIFIFLTNFFNSWISKKHFKYSLNKSNGVHILHLHICMKAVQFGYPCAIWVLSRYWSERSSCHRHFAKYFVQENNDKLLCLNIIIVLMELLQMWN